MSQLILLVEDEELIRATAFEYLIDVGFAVIEAAHGGAEVATLQGTSGIDLVFTDVHMPGVMDGHALARWIQVNLPHIPVLLTSGIDKPPIGSSGAHRRFIAKPYSLVEVERHVRELLH